jgi:hypothetical protein
MVQADLPGVLAVASNAFDRDHAQRGQREFNEMFAAAALRPFFYIAEIDGTVVGLAGYGESRLAYGVYELYWVGVQRNIATKASAKSSSCGVFPIWRPSRIRSSS